jgi:hypothetical protein
MVRQRNLNHLMDRAEEPEHFHVRGVVGIQPGTKDLTHLAQKLREVRGNLRSTICAWYGRGHVFTPNYFRLRMKACSWHHFANRVARTASHW